MKKHFVIPAKAGIQFTILLLCSLLLATPALADWSVTVTWTRSAGPNLDYEEVVYNDNTQCTVQETDPTTCVFVLPALGGNVLVRSWNDQGAYVDTVPVTISEVPAPASGIIVNVTYVQP